MSDFGPKPVELGPNEVRYVESFLEAGSWSGAVELYLGSLGDMTLPQRDAVLRELGGYRRSPRVLREIIRRVVPWKTTWAAVAGLAKGVLVETLLDEGASTKDRVTASKIVLDAVVKGGLARIGDVFSDADSLAMKDAVESVLGEEGTKEELRRLQAKGDVQ